MIQPKPTRSGAAWLKLDLLAQGLELDPSIAELAAPGRPIATRRNFYNSPGRYQPYELIPQELRILDLTVALNSYGRSRWRLVWNPVDRALSVNDSLADGAYPVETIEDLRLFSLKPDAARLANLYGGAALAFFSPRSCYFFADGSECRFCSLAGTANETRQLKGLLSADDVRNTVSAALTTDRDQIEQVMIVGGNMRDLDRGFRHHVSLATAAADAVRAANLSAEVSVHVATMPPRDLSLLRTLRELPNVHVMFNLEVWDSERFRELCPGKAKDYGRDQMLKALEQLRDAVGVYRAHSLLIAGLEPPESLAIGARRLAEMGISPIVNVYHSDRHSALGVGSRPSFDDLAEIATELQSLHDEFPIQPYWRRCGRNSIDAEAGLHLFHAPIPETLARPPDRW